MNRKKEQRLMKRRIAFITTLSGTVKKFLAFYIFCLKYFRKIKCLNNTFFNIKTTKETQWRHSVSIWCLPKKASQEKMCENISWRVWRFQTSRILFRQNFTRGASQNIHTTPIKYWNACSLHSLLHDLATFQAQTVCISGILFFL